MSSPKKFSRAASLQGRRLNEPLLPLHLALGWIIIRVFPIGGECQYLPVYSVQFTHRILQILAREVMEVGSEPANFQSLRQEVDRLVKVEVVHVTKRNQRKKARGQTLDVEYDLAENDDGWLWEMSTRFSSVPDGCRFIDGLDKDLKERLNLPEEDEPTESAPPMERHSPLGIFSRNLINMLRRLSFDETAHLSEEVAKWCGVSSSGPSKPVTTWSLDRKSGMEDTLDKRTAAMQDYQAASNSADYSGALTSLRRFFDYQFPSAGRGLHHHALLNIAVFHYLTGGLETARSSVHEAIRVARTAGDKECLQHCMSLSRRLQTEIDTIAFAPGETIRVHQTAIPTSRLPAASTPMDELWNIRTALDLGEPIHIAFRRIYTALGMSSRTEVSPFAEEGDDRQYGKQWSTGQALDLAAWHTTQSGLWDLMGSNALAQLHEDMASEGEGRLDGGLTVLIARAQRLAGQAKYDSALGVLTDISSLSGMSMEQYHGWARVVWAICERWSDMNNHAETSTYLRALQPPKSSSRRLGPGGPLREHGHPRPIPVTDDGEPQIKGKFTKRVRLLQDHIQDSLKTASDLQSTSAPPHLVLPHVLSAVQLSSELGMWRLYRFGVIVLAECMMAMEGIPMAVRVIEEIESVWSQVQASNDCEALARGSLCMAKAHIDLALDQNSLERLGVRILMESDSSLDAAKVCLETAITHARALESRRLLLESTCLKALVAQLEATEDFRIGPQAGSMKEKSEAEAELDTYEGLKGGSGGWPLYGEIIREVGEIVRWVGVRAAEGWQ